MSLGGADDTGKVSLSQDAWDLVSKVLRGDNIKPIDHPLYIAQADAAGVVHFDLVANARPQTGPYAPRANKKRC
jgi:hypothetical protein